LKSVFSYLFLFVDFDHTDTHHFIDIKPILLDVYRNREFSGLNLFEKYFYKQLMNDNKHKWFYVFIT